MFCMGWIGEPRWKQRQGKGPLDEQKQMWSRTSIICRWNTFSPASHLCSSWRNQRQRAKPRRSQGCSVVWHQFWLTATWIVSPYVPRLKITWSEMYTCLIYILEPSTLTPRVVWQSDFCFRIWNSRRRRLEGRKQLIQIFSLLPTLAADCTNLHANDCIYILWQEQ